jgi:hypothetical protein
MSDDEGGLLSILQAHGQRFLQSFTLPTDRIKKRKYEDDANGVTKKSRNVEDNEYEEWHGIHDTPNERRDDLAEDSDIGMLHNFYSCSVVSDS